MILLSRREQETTTDGDIHKAVWQPAAFCIPLLRPYRHQRVSEQSVATRTGGLLLPADSGHSGREQRSAEPAHRRLQNLGGIVRPQSWHTDRMGGKRRAQGGLRPARAAPDGEEERLWCLLYLQKHGTGPDVPHQRAEVPGEGSEPPDSRAPAQPVHALLLLHPVSYTH